MFPSAATNASLKQLKKLHHLQFLKLQRANKLAQTQSLLQIGTLGGFGLGLKRLQIRGLIQGRQLAFPLRPNGGQFGRIAPESTGQGHPG